MKTKATTADAYKLFHDGILALAQAERQGIRIDIEYCEKKKKHLTRKINHYQEKLQGTKFYRRWNAIYGGKTNIYSNHQLSQLLYKHMKIEPIRTTESGAGSTDEVALAQINLPELQLILKMRKLAKIRDTYLDAFVREQNNGVLHPSFNLHNVKTYRSSSSDPNFQNIPKRDKEAMEICRRAFLPRPGHMLMGMDFASLEVNIAACYCKDPTLIKYLKDRKADMHLDMAKQIFMFDELDKTNAAHNILRQAAKNGFVFPQFYGDYYGNNAHSLCDWTKLPKGGWKQGKGILLPTGEPISNHLIRNGIRSFQQFTDHMKKVEDDFWNRRFRVYNQWRKSWVEQYTRKGYLQMLTGFICSGIMRRNEIINYPIQGTAFHCLMFTFNRLDEIMREEQWDSRLIGQIHDEIVADVSPEEQSHIEQTAHRIVREELPKAWPWIIVPLEIEVETYGVDGTWIKTVVQE